MKKRRGFFKAVFCFILIITSIVAGCVIILDRLFPVRHLETIREYSDEFGVDPVLVCAVINAESRFKANAVSSVGASGLMQIMESTAYWVAPKAGLTDFDYDDILDPDVNIRIGICYLNMLIEQFVSLNTALAAYNAGSGNVEAWLSNPDYSSNGKTLDKIPFSETDNFVERVGNNIKVYDRLLPLMYGIKLKLQPMKNVLIGL